MSQVRDHFEKEASRYDSWKQRNWYYYDAIKKMYKERIPRDMAVLEIGCGTGDILATIAPRRGVGIDISPAMIERAKRKHPRYEWHALTISELGSVLRETFDVVFLSDVIEHLEDIDGTFRDLRPLCHGCTRLIINMANPLWEPALLFLEMLRLKMPEGPHRRIGVRTLNRALQRHGFILGRRSFRLFFPMYIPFISSALNLVEKVPILRRLCLIEILEYKLR